jgi:hypothetical protein
MRSERSETVPAVSAAPLRTKMSIWKIDVEEAFQNLPMKWLLNNK